MAEEHPNPARFIGLDIRKEYLIAIGVNREQEQVFGPQRVPLTRLDGWIKKHLRPDDAVVLEMTTNTYEVHDILKPRVQSVTVVHPPHVALITRNYVKTDKKAALALAQLHAAGLLPPVWIPPEAVRELRALVAQRKKMVSLLVQVKCRLHAVLHRHHILPPEKDLFAPAQRGWWSQLPISALEQMRVQLDLETLDFAQQQVKKLTDCLAQETIQDERLPLLLQLPGFGLLNSVAVLAAIGDISRFPSAKQLVGYAGLGAKVHDSGQTYRTGKITKTGRRDLRAALVEAAQSAARTHPKWKAELARLQPRLGRNKAIVAIARKLLVVVWHVLTNEAADRNAKPEQVACSMFAHAYKVGVSNLPEGMSALTYTRRQLDRLGVGAELTHIPWGSKQFQLPPSAVYAPIPP